MTGEPTEYTNWGSEEPNDDGEQGEDCVEVQQGGRRNDMPCREELGFICEGAFGPDTSDPGDACDNCPEVSNPDQTDRDGDGVADARQVHD